MATIYSAQLTHANQGCVSTCRCLGPGVQGVKGGVRDRATVEALIPSAIEGENVSYEALSPADIFRPSFCSLHHVTLCSVPQIVSAGVCDDMFSNANTHQPVYFWISLKNPLLWHDSFIDLLLVSCLSVLCVVPE